MPNIHTHKPIYLIGHRCNNLGDIDKAIRRGANAVECDIQHSGGFYVDHDVAANGVRLNAWLDRAKQAADRYGDMFALVYFDFKDALKRNVKLSNFIEEVHNHPISTETKLKFIYSVAEADGAKEFADCYPILHPNEGFCVDYDNDVAKVSQLYKDGGITRCWYANGVNAGTPLVWPFAPNVKPSLRRANNYRGMGIGELKKTMSWTYESKSSVKLFLKRNGDYKTDALIVNCGGGITSNAMGSVLAGFYELDGLRLATCQDDPFVYNRAWYFSDVTVSHINLNPANLTLDRGTTQTLSATVSPNNATNKTLTWMSSTPAVAAVNTNGLVSARAPGSTVITAKAADMIGIPASCVVSASCVVRVIIAISQIALNKSRLTLIPGTAETLSATISPDDATDKTVNWTSSNSAVAMLNTLANNKSRVTAFAAGSATISVQAADIGRVSTNCAVTVIPGIRPELSSELWSKYSLSHKADGTPVITLDGPDVVPDWAQVYIPIPGVSDTGTKFSADFVDLTIRNVNQSITDFCVNLDNAADKASYREAKLFWPSREELLNGNGTSVLKNADGTTTLRMDLRSVYNEFKGKGAKAVRLKVFIESVPEHREQYGRWGSVEFFALKIV